MTEVRGGDSIAIQPSSSNALMVSVRDVFKEARKAEPE